MLHPAYLRTPGVIRRYDPTKIRRLHATLSAIDFALIVTTSNLIKSFVGSIGWTLFLPIAINRICELAYYFCIAGNTTRVYSILQAICFGIAAIVASQNKVLVLVFFAWECLILGAVVNMFPEDPFFSSCSAICSLIRLPDVEVTNNDTHNEIPLIEVYSIQIKNPDGSMSVGLSNVPIEYEYVFVSDCYSNNI